MEEDNKPTEQPKTQKQEQKKDSFWELVRYAILALIIIIPFRIFVAQPYVVSGSSMDPTFQNGNYLIVDQLSERFGIPTRQSVVIIRYPKNPSEFFIKRLIAFPRETVEIKNGNVYIFNQDHPDGFKLDEPYVVYKDIQNFKQTLNPDQYFVMGDNRAGSSDSRIWGPVPRKYIVGTPILRLLPLNELGVSPGSIN